MNPVPLFLIIVSLPLLLGGCGVEKPVVETKPLEEKVLEVKEEVKAEEPLAETTPELEGVKRDDLEFRDRIAYFKDTPYTGKSFDLYENGQRRLEGSYKDGEMDGLWTLWHENGQRKIEEKFKDGKKEGSIFWDENGQKRSEVNWKDGEIVSQKGWDEKGELSYEE